MNPLIIRMKPSGNVVNSLVHKTWINELHPHFVVVIASLGETSLHEIDFNIILPLIELPLSWPPNETMQHAKRDPFEWGQQ
jgi:hypothetical protein